MDISQVTIDTASHAEIVRELCERLRDLYVFPDIAKQLCDVLQKNLDDGEYEDIQEAELFALALTLHVQEASQDEHLWVKWHPEPLPEAEGPLRENQAWMDAQRLEAELDNCGFHKVERLPGNVGYVDIHQFHRVEWGGETAAAAMNFLANASALIIDLRRCKGGTPGMVALVSSYLFDEPVHLNSIYWHEEDFTQQYWTLPHVPGKRFGDKPVYLLTSRYTFSGGEEFAYNLKTRQRATLVGETTGGGAHAGSMFRLHPHFEAFIPHGRAINPITQENWQGRGVPPDIAVSQEEALRAAHRMALESIIESTAQAATGPSRLLLEEAQSALQNLEGAEP